MPDQRPTRVVACDCFSGQRLGYLHPQAVLCCTSIGVEHLKCQSDDPKTCGAFLQNSHTGLMLTS